MSTEKQALLRRIPSVEVLLSDERIARLTGEFPRTIVTDAVRRTIDDLRRAILEGTFSDGDAVDLPTLIADRSVDRVAALMRPQFRRAVNAMGIILHTGLGRAVLCRQAVDAIATELAGYSVLQVDLESGKRGRRDARIEQLLQRITGAEAATVVNNNAAATSIVLNTVGAGREVLVSRGQLVEIGGSFRLPDVMAFSGAKMVEVGTTNKTHARDYENAITEETAAILRVHPSNYKISGFTSEVPLETLVEIGRKHGVIVIDDVGAGPLVDVTQFGFEREPTLQESVATGADLITSSADKLIGASQGGIILGRKDLVAKVRKNPFARIVRPGKLTLAALEATLDLFLDEEKAMRELPTLRMLRRTIDELDEQASRIAESLRERLDARVDVVDGFSQMGSGSLPTQDLPTRLVALTPSTSPDAIAGRLRLHDPPVFARVRDERLLFDPRTLLDGDEQRLIDAVVDVLVD